jgi:hypothetical protein
MVGRWTRRGWLKAAAGVGAIAVCRPVLGADTDTDAEAAEIEAQARKARLGPFRSTTTERYFGIGDAPDDHRNQALKWAAALADTYLQVFQEKGFHVAFPPRHLTVLTLKDKASYLAFGGDPDTIAGGHYNLETNRLVIFDFRGGNNLPKGANLERINGVALSHEAMHQLTFNTGLLERQGDVPLAISEGLGMYAELWRPDGRTVLGMINRLRLQVLVDRAKQDLRQGEIWIPLATLLTRDDLFDDPANRQLAYAEAWVLVHYLIRNPGALPKFRAYLDAIRPRHDASQRLADAKAHLGDLERLNTTLRKEAKRLIQE